MTKGLTYIDTVEKNIVDVYYDIKNNIFYRIDYRNNKKTKVNPRVYRSSKCIRVCVSVNGVKKQWTKTISHLLYEKLNIVTDELKRLDSWDIKDYKNKILKFYNENGYVIKYNDMRIHKNVFWRVSYANFNRNYDGISTYHNINKELGILDDAKYFDHNKTHLRSSYEFITFSILHFNGIKYSYEPFRVENRVPDFYVKNDNLIIEILGVRDTFNIDYSSVTEIKSTLYGDNGYNYLPVKVDNDNPKKSIFKVLKSYYPTIKEPDYTEYLKKYTLNGIELIEELKNILVKVNCGELPAAKRKGETFCSKYPYIYTFCLDNYGSTYEAILSLLGVHSKNVCAPKGYWYDEENCLSKILSICEEHNFVLDINLSWRKFQPHFKTLPHVWKKNYNGSWVELKKRMIELKEKNFLTL